PLLIAGSGGGGGSASSTHNYTGGNGGAGGGTNGVAGSNDGTGNNFGGPGGQQAEYRTGLVNYVGQIGSGRYRGTPGYGYNYMICYEHQDTYNFLGGAPGGVNYAGSQACGGGGGDGYCGGIGGAGDNYLYGGGGGGGGSGYTGYGTLTAGSGRTPPNTSDSDYDGVAGVGGLGASSGAVNAGTRGLIVVRA
ncbi:MAG: hypothetical protein FJ029_16140, partial [Actinobacteria bacterium]|nr:hypothetical protein [Actinomycetota bacterium]